MSLSLSQALQTVSTHREVVPLYYVRSTGQFIIAGLTATHGGAVIVGDDGPLRTFPSKSAALASMRGSNNN